MINRKKVIKGLEHCDFGVSDTCYEKECPYYRSHDCTEELKNDILILLKEQEEEIENLKQTAQSMMEGICLLKEQEPVTPNVDSEKTCSCGNCGTTVGYYPAGCKTPEKLCKFCPECGRKVKWE